MRCNTHHWPPEEGECPYCEIQKSNDAYLGIKADHEIRAAIDAAGGEG